MSWRLLVDRFWLETALAVQKLVLRNDSQELYSEERFKSGLEERTGATRNQSKELLKLYS